MIFPVLSVIVPVLVYFLLPRILQVGKNWKWLLFVACVIYFTAWYLPSPLIEGRNTQFMTHFVGGGIFTGMIWFYVKKVKTWQAKWYIEALSLFALVSALGVANELFELLLYITGHMPQGIADTSWDLLANTLGALTFYIAYTLTRLVRERNAARRVS